MLLRPSHSFHEEITGPFPARGTCKTQLSEDLGNRVKETTGMLRIAELCFELQISMNHTMDL